MGNIVFDQHIDPQEGIAGWDGNHQGPLLPPGVYTYQVVLQMEDRNSRNRTGAINLIR